MGFGELFFCRRLDDDCRSAGMREEGDGAFGAAPGSGASGVCVLPLGRPVVWATSPLGRLRGLLGREGFGGLCFIVPCDDIHTFGLRKPIDAAFVDVDGRVLSVWRSMPPLRRKRVYGAALVVERFAREGAWLRAGDMLGLCVEEGAGRAGDGRWAEREDSHEGVPRMQDVCFR